MSDREVNRRDFLGSCARGGAALGLLPLASNLDLGLATSQLPLGAVNNVASVRARYWHPVDAREIICDLCPSRCQIQHGERGTCGVRENENGAYISKVYGKPCEYRRDPVEKGPFFHFLPGTNSLAIGLAGCNLDCKYCQSASFAKARPEVTDNKNLSPRGLASQLVDLGWQSVTFTFSEPLQSIEYVLDVASLVRPHGVKVLVHTAAWFLSEPFEDVCNSVDAVNIDLKGFTEDFYRNVTGGTLEPVLNNIRRARSHPNLWLELTNLVIPGYNDNDETFYAMCQWIMDNCGPDTPLHVSKFFPQYKFRNLPPTPNETLRRLRKLAFRAGLRYVYLGNMAGDPGESSYCPKCGVKMISRVSYDVSFPNFDPQTATCTKCGLRIPGMWG